MDEHVSDTIDVMVCTYNSARTLEVCLQSIVDNIPVRKIWVIDKHSRDMTINIAEQFHANVIQTDVSLAESRRLGFNLVETEYFANVDSDVVLCDDWFNKIMQSWTDRNVGCVWGIGVNQEKLHEAYQTTMYRFREPTKYHIPHLLNMVSRRSILRNIEYPASICSGSVAGEDYLIMKWIEQQGFRCIVAPVYVKHYSVPSQMKKSSWGGASLRLLKRENIITILSKLILVVPQATLAALVTHEPSVIPYLIEFRSRELYGWLNWHRYVTFERTAQ